jgi:hypothetical protein
MTKIMAAIAAFLLAIALATPAEAKHRHKRHHRQIDPNGNYLTVRTALGLTSKVIASAADKFQGFIDALEIDHIEPETGELTKGNRITDIGCLSSGHMRNSKHHWGGACDFMQERRNVTASFMYHVTHIAQRFGLTDGCIWSGRGRYGGPDCGHIEVPGPNVASRNPTYRMAKNDKSRHVRVATK